MGIDAGRWRHTAISWMGQRREKGRLRRKGEKTRWVGNLNCKFGNQ